jgi:hypothetical protein
MESIKYNEIVVLEDVEKRCHVCRLYEILSGEHFKHCGEVELSDKSIVDYNITFG